jgi:hypothetical protein
MISELKDDEILDFLMTSDFEQEYKPEELKYLLFKWRYFYRILNGKFDLHKTNSNWDIEHLQEEVKRLKTQISENQSIIAMREDQINGLKNRKLTFKERLSGKIINNDEN